MQADVVSPATYPLVFFVLAKNTNITHSQGLLYYGDKDSAFNRFILQYQGDQSFDPVRYVIQNLAGTTVAIPVTPGFYNGFWLVLAGRSLAANDHKFYRGTNTAVSSTSITPTNTDSLEIARISGTSPGAYADASTYYVGLANAMTDAQYTEMFDGRHPRNVFGSGELIHLWTFQTNGDLTDEIGGLVLTANNAPTWIANPVTIWPGSNDVGVSGAAGSIEGSGFNDVKSTGKIELVDNSVYASGTKVEQTTSSWDDGQIDFTFDVGGLTPGSLWLFVTNSGGEISAGFPVTVTSPSAETSVIRRRIEGY